MSIEVLKMAEYLASKPAASIALGKGVFYKQLEAAKEVAYEITPETVTWNLLTENAQAGVDTFIAKKTMPEWKG